MVFETDQVYVVATDRTPLAVFETESPEVHVFVTGVASPCATTSVPESTTAWAPIVSSPGTVPVYENEATPFVSVVSVSFVGLAPVTVNVTDAPATGAALLSVTVAVTVCCVPIRFEALAGASVTVSGATSRARAGRSERACTSPAAHRAVATVAATTSPLPNVRMYPSPIRDQRCSHLSL